MKPENSTFPRGRNGEPFINQRTLPMTSGPNGGASRALSLWRHDYNTTRPHSALSGKTPASARRAHKLWDGSALGALANQNALSYLTSGLSQ